MCSWYKELYVLLICFKCLNLTSDNMEVRAILDVICIN